MTINPETQSISTAAQIPLQTFNLPSFPLEAANLQHLTLTSDIKPTEYADILASPLPQTAIPSSLPNGIDSLTLELFSLGYPAPFLTKLGKALPRLKALTIYSHLIDGVSEDSRRDAGEFIHNALTGTKENPRGLRELHLLDAFCRRGFIEGIGDILHDSLDGERANFGEGSGLRFLEVSYTYRGHSDPEFLSRISADELPGLFVSSLIAASFRLSPPPAVGSEAGLEDVPDDPADVDENGEVVSGKKPAGIVPVHSTHSGTALLVEKLTGGSDQEARDEASREPTFGNLKMLDCTLYTLSIDQLERVLRHQRQLAVLSVSVLVPGDEGAKGALLDAIRAGSEELEIVEIVGVPEQEIKDMPGSTNREEYFRDLFPSASDIVDLSAGLPRLESLSMTILRAPGFGSVSWTRGDGKWKDGNVSDKGEQV